MSSRKKKSNFILDKAKHSSDSESDQEDDKLTPEDKQFIDDTLATAATHNPIKTKTKLQRVGKKLSQEEKADDVADKISEEKALKQLENTPCIREPRSKGKHKSL